MKRSFLFVFFCCLCISLQAQSTVPAENFVFGESVPDYLRKVIKEGNVTVNGHQKITSEPEIIPFEKRQYRNYGPTLRLHAEAVIFLEDKIISRPEIDLNSIFPTFPNLTPSLFGIRGGSETMGGPTAEQSLLTNISVK